MIAKEELCTGKERLFSNGVWDQKIFPSSSEVSFMLLEGRNVGSFLMFLGPPAVVIAN